MKLLKILLLTACVSCGFISDEPVENSDLYTSKDPLGPGCELDPDRFTQIFDEDIEDQIKCVRENFVQFNRFVLTRNPDVITEGELQQFIKKFFAQNSQTIVKALQVLFELNMVMLRDHASTLSRDNIDSLTEILINVNKEGVIITRLLRTMTGPDRYRHYPKARTELLASLRRLTTQTKVVIEKTNRVPQTLNLREFVLNFNDSFPFSQDTLTPELLDSLLFLKKIFLGGDKVDLTSVEVLHLLDIAPELFIQSFDLMMADEKMFSSQKDPSTALRNYYQERILSIRNLFFQITDDEVLFTQDDLYRIYDAVIKDSSLLEEFDLNEYREILKSLKANLIGGHPENYNFVDLNRIFLFVNLGLELLTAEAKYTTLTKGIDLKPAAEIQALKPKFNSLVETTKNKILTLISQIPVLPSELKIIPFVHTLNDQLSSVNISPELLSSLSSIKVYFLGGDRQNLADKEIYQFLDKAQIYGDLYYDFSFILPVLKQTDLTQSEFLRVQLQALQTLSFTDDSIGDEAREAFSHQDILTLIDQVFSDADDRTLYRNLYLSYKGNILRSNSGSLTAKEINQTIQFGVLLTHLMDFLDYHQEMDIKFKALASDDTTQYQTLKSEYLLRLEQIMTLAKDLLEKPRLFDQDLYFFDFLNDLSILFEDIDFETDLLADLLPVKSLFLGGDKESLSFEEAQNLITKISLLAPTILDFVYQSSISDLTFVDLIKTLRKALYDTQSEDSILSLNDILKVAARFVDLPLSDFAPTISILKQKIVGGLGTQFRGVDIGKILDLAQELFEVRAYSDMTYNHMQLILDTSRAPLRQVARYQLMGYNQLTSSKLQKYHQIFSDTLMKHRYFRDPETGMQNWGHSIVRNKSGVIESISLKWLIAHLVNGWGSPSPKVYQGHSMSQVELEKLLVDAKPILQEFGLWTANFATFARNTLLLGDLFQNRSNGDQRLDTDELLEYGLMVLSAIDLNGKFMEQLTKFCKPVTGTNSEDWTFETTCYRSHFFPIIMDQFNYARYLPMLDRYVKTEDREKVAAFLKNVEGFSRDINDEAIPMGSRDFVLLVGALINIETTFIRFDSNKDNMIDATELEAAFKIYENAIIQIAELDDDREKFAKSIFLYMIKNMAIPSQTQLLNFHYNPFISKDIVAYRLNIGLLLYYLVQ